MYKNFFNSIYNYKDKVMKDFEIFIAVKAILASIFGWFSSALFYFLPIKSIIEGLLLSFALSFIFGVIYGVRCQMENIDKDKAFVAIKELAVYLLILASLFTIGERMNDDETVYQFLRVITWGLIYVYFTNFTKNLSRLFPGIYGIKMIHYVLNAEFFKKQREMKKKIEDETED